MMIAHSIVNLDCDRRPYRVILDDGSHITSYTIDTFRHLFGAGLADGGTYIVEDVHSNYWKDYRDSQLSFIDFARGTPPVWWRSAINPSR